MLKFNQFSFTYCDFNVHLINYVNPCYMFIPCVLKLHS